MYKPAKIEKLWIFRIPIYGYRVNVVVSTDIEKSVKKHGFDTDMTGTKAIHFVIKDQPVSWIFLPADSGINEIVHEGTHVVQRIIHWIGAKYDDREFVAYLMAHVIQGVYEFHEHAKNVLK